MGAWVIFRRARIYLFCFMVLTCLTWATLFAIFLFPRWSHFSLFQKILLVSSVSLYGFTAVLLYLMAVTHFRLWWDVARLFLLLIFHTGSSFLFTVSRPSFPCHSFGKETVCKKFVFAIFIGCWVLSGIIFCFIFALGVMALIPQPVGSLQVTEEVDVPPSPASFKAGNPMDEATSFYSIDSRTGFVTYNNGGNSPDCTPSPVNSARGDTVTMGPPRLWHGFESPNLGHGNDTYGGTTGMSMRNSPTEHTSTIPGLQRVDSFHHNPLGNTSPPPVSINSRAPMIRPGVGGKNSLIAGNRLNQSPAFPGLKHDALSPSSLHGSPPPVTIPRDLATEYKMTYPDRARTETPSIYTINSSAASVYSTWVEPNPHIPPPPVLNPDIAGSNSYLGPKDSSPGNNAPSATSRSNAPLTQKLSEPHRALQYYGALSAQQPYRPPVKERSNGQVLDQPQWRRLVLNAAAKP